MKFSIEEIILAKELCFPERFEKWAKANFNTEEAAFLEYEFKTKGNDLIKWIFTYSRADLERCFPDGELDILINGLLGRNK